MDQDMMTEALRQCIEKIKINMENFSEKFPHVSEQNVYMPQKNDLWTSSFWPGMVYLAYCCFKDEALMKYKDKWLDSFEERLNDKSSDTHDLGFLYTLSCVSLYKIEGNERAKGLALRAAEKLISRYNEEGRYIKAWENESASIDLMIDTMMNIPLLFWSSEVTGDKKFREIAVKHAITSSKHLVRKDGSTYHICPYDYSAGELLKGKTFQGRYDETTWARGQGWAIYGFALCYKYTKDEYFISLAKKAADYFMKNNKAKDYVPYWDMSFTDESPDLKDSSAASIAACGLMELSYETEDNKYKEYAMKIEESLYKYYFTGLSSKSNGILLQGVYHRNLGADECNIWGDYFYLEALARLNNNYRIFW
ncbi:unsaturated chondroitin disaccharide hydrolase [Clostridium amylolyticum]|uniref:Unsaturated chondroitin disaccharide hydrolase n=1 Tax=Clostridium amylolyticum TaxID=1121298 RepID=A0A1M6HAB0_9CLOT|nr:glycoside hydrolase family 88 protein [Clostridium amylolyticum]SHJ19148.1 unsaturated chondroitin disaccharide hydrolase [Clostridium amylolyticum]